LTLFSDEAWFRLQGYIITQNKRYWSSQKPHLIHEVPLRPVKFGIWCALSVRKIVGPVFFNETINCERCVQAILGQFFPELTGEERLCGWFEQDSATAHIARMSMHAVPNIFGDRIICSDIWPARSPDLNPCAFFLRGFFEGQSLQQ
jgi:hypothetical protein